MDKPLIIYHGGCDDGFGAAFAIWGKLGSNAEYFPGVYGKTPPDVTDRDVVLVDISYKRDVMVQLARAAKSTLVLDHHESAQRELDSLDKVVRGVTVHFDMERSGAMMAWNHFHPGVEPPLFFKYLQDRDLWRKQLPDGDAFTMALRSYPQEFQVWNEFLWDGGVERLIEEGRPMLKFYRQKVEEVKKTVRMMKIGEHVVPVANCPYFMASEVAGELAEGHPFAACYFDHADGRTFSLRSRKDGVAVNKIAEKFGGGGHPGAAGFRMPL